MGVVSSYVEELLKRLRKMRWRLEPHQGLPHIVDMQYLCTEAASEIERLERQVEDLEQELRHAQGEA